MQTLVNRPIDKEDHRINTGAKAIITKFLSRDSVPFCKVSQAPSVKNFANKVRWKLVKLEDAIKIKTIREGKRRRQWIRRHSKRSIKYIMLNPEKKAKKNQQVKKTREDFWNIRCD